jgi:ankyrin repeat protein
MLLDAGVPAGGAKGGYPPLNLAAHYGHADVVNALLKHGADANVRDSSGWAPLHMALLLEVQEQQRRPMSPSCPVVVSLLVQHGANVRAPGSSFKITPLHLAAQLGAVEVMEFLIEHGADVNARDGRGLTPLHEAVSNEHLQAAEMLLDRGADANARSEFGCPLHLAARHSHPEIVELLLARRADVDSRDARGLSPLDVAIQGCGGLEPNAARTAMVATLLRAGADRRSTPGKTPPLHRAVAEGDVEVAGLLIAHGADTRQFDENGLTPLHLAVSRQNPDMVEWLLAKGADVNARDRGGETPLQYALRGEGPAVRIRELLRAHGGVE